MTMFQKPDGTGRGSLRWSWCRALSLMAAVVSASAQTPGTLTYEAEIEITKSRLLTTEQYELVRSMLPIIYWPILDEWISQVQAGHRYEYQVGVWADRGNQPAMTVHLTFPSGLTRVGTANGDGGLEFGGWTTRFHSFSELKAALPPGTYSITAMFTDGSGERYTAQLHDYTEASFPEFVPGVLTWSGTADAPLVLKWKTIPQTDEYEISAWEFPDGNDLFDSGNISPSYPNTLTTTLLNTHANTRSYGVHVQAERDSNAGQFRHEFSTGTEYHFLAAGLIHPQRSGTGAFQCDVVGGSGTSYAVQASTNLRDWIPLQVDTVLDDGSFRFADSIASGASWRSYRAVCAPAP